MRYPVDDEFAIGLSRKLYELLAAKGQPLPRAVAMTLKQLSQDGGPGGRAFPALSMAAPTIFGGQATQLRLPAPRRSEPVSYATGNLKMAGFPLQPDLFVGRTGVMARVSEALAAESGVPGALLHGMPGGGKTACALELAYCHEHAWRGKDAEPVPAGDERVGPGPVGADLEDSGLCYFCVGRELRER